MKLDKKDSKDEYMHLFTEITELLDEIYVYGGRFRGNGIITIEDTREGNFKRLNELGITKDDLIANGWNKSPFSETMLKAIEKCINKKYNFQLIKK
jgi:hypothetical protein